MSRPARPWTNLAARAGAFSAAHWKRAAVGWLAFAIAALLVGGAVGSKSLSESEMASGEAAKAERILEDAGFTEPATESVLIQSRKKSAILRLPRSPSPTSERGSGGTSPAALNPRFASVVAKVTRALSRQPEVTKLRDPLKRRRSLVSRDGRSVLVQFDIRGKRDDAPDKVEPILDAVAALQRQNKDFRIEEFGSASAVYVTDQTIGEDFRRAEKLSVPITLLVLLLAFGALVAASVPVLLAFSAVLAALGLGTLVSHLVPAADATQSVILLIGMAVGVDYSLFYLRRAREERAAGNDPGNALLRAAGTSGQAVLVSGATVLVAMAGMLFAGATIFTSIGVGAMIVVFAAMVGSLTVLPAILHKLGDRVERGRIPLLGRLRRPAGQSRLWGAILRPVLRWPAAAALVSASVLAAAALPAFQMHTKLPSFTDLPRSVPLVGTYERIQQAFPGSQTPAEVVVKADRVTGPAYRKAYREFQRRAARTGFLYQPFHVFLNRDRTVGRVEFSMAGNGDNAISYRALDALRNDVVAPIAARLPDAEVAVTGETAATHDANETMKNRAPLVFAFVLGLAFLLLLLSFRSIVVPLKAIALNLLSVGAAYGILIMVFQWGNLEGPLGFHSNGAIASWLPLFLFVVLFGLSMDYHVFILSRVKELVDRGMPTAQAVDQGICTTAGTVTAAAAVMIAVFAIFAGLREISVKQMGFGLAVAVLIDATIIRAVLLPATMKLLGDRNWYLPRWLEWLPSLAAASEQRELPRPARSSAMPGAATGNGARVDKAPAGGSSARRERPRVPVG